MKQTALLAAYFLTIMPAFAQPVLPQAYFDLVQQADSLYQAKDFIHAARSYSEAFKAGDGKVYPNDRYAAACAWALAGVPDSAFVQLQKIAPEMTASQYQYVAADENLNVLHGDARWAPLLESIKRNEARAPDKIKQREEVSGEAGRHPRNPLAARLDSILTEDQWYRMRSGDIERQFGWDSEEMRAHLKTIGEKDSLNLIQVKAIFDKYGWLSAEEVGESGAAALFLVIQHSGLTTQEAYLPMLREAVKNGKAKLGDLAMLEDRIAIRQGKRQIYGSQIGRDPETLLFFVSPLDDPDNVDKRRAEAGLMPMAQYVSRWQIKWDVEQYKKDLPKLEEKIKRINGKD